MADDGRPLHGTGQASEFYLACRNGELDKVNRLLKTLTARDVNKIEESNRSTALHAATYFGHTQVVKRLLEIGASVYTHNGHGLTPEQEASSEAMKALFREHKEKQNK